MSDADILEITDATFDQAVLSDLPILLDFGAPIRCAPCRMILPHLRAIASEYRDRVRVGTIDADEYPDIAARFGVRSLPTLIMVRQREVVGQLIGAVPRARIRALVDAALT